MPYVIGGIVILYLGYVLIKAMIFFIKTYLAPALGALIIFIIAIGAGYAIYMYLKDPTKRAVKDLAGKAEAERQKIIVHRELKRKLSAEGEQAQAKAMLLSSQLYEKTKLAMGNESINSELDLMRIEAEEKILTSKIEDIDSIIFKYKETIGKIERSDNLSSEEKAQLYKNATSIINLS